MKLLAIVNNQQSKIECNASPLSSKMNFNFAIIGGGLTATCMLYQFVEKVRQKTHLDLLNPSRIGIQVFEKQDTFGPGFPHCHKYVMPFHITNMCAKDMGIVFGNSGDFQDWVGQVKGNWMGLNWGLMENVNFWDLPHSFLPFPCRNNRGREALCPEGEEPLS